MTTTAQQSREELLAIGKRKLLQFQQSKGKSNANSTPAQTATSSTSSSASVAPLSASTSRLPTVTVNGKSDASNKHNQPAPFTSSSSHPSSATVSFPSTSLQHSSYSPLPAPVPTPTPRRDLFPFLDAAAGTSEPNTPPSSDFHAPHASFLQADHADSGLPPSSSPSLSVTPTPTLPPSAAVDSTHSTVSSLAPYSSSALAGISATGASSYSAYDAQVDYNPYDEPPPAVLARSGAATPLPAESHPPPSSSLSSRATEPSAATITHEALSSQAGTRSAVVDSNISDPSFHSYFPSSLSSASSAPIVDRSIAATTAAAAPTSQTQPSALSSSPSHTVSVLSTASSAPPTTSSTETEQPYDTTAASVQYYQDDAGNIFYYATDGQPIYYNQASGDYSITPPSTSAATSSLPSSSAASSGDVSTLQQKVAEYERYIATLQSSLVSSTASPLPALSSLSAELDLSRTDNERLQGQLRQLQSRLESQSKAMSELMEDNATLVHEYEEVCEQLQGAEEERRQGWIKQRDEDTEQAVRQDGAGGVLCEHSDVLQQLSDDSARVQRELVEGMQLTTTIRSQWHHVLQLIQHAHEQSLALSTPSSSDASTAVIRANGVGGSKADWLSVLQQAEALSSLLSQKEDLDHRFSMHVGHVRQLLDPVALVLSPSHPHNNTSAATLPLLMSAYSASPPSITSTALVPSTHTSLVAADGSSSSSNTFDTAALSSLQAENSMLHDQLAAQQERADTLIKDKVMLAKRIEAAFEEKAVLTESLRDALDELGREKEMYKQAVHEAHNTAVRTANTTAYTPSPVSLASPQAEYDQYVDSGSLHAAYQRLHTPSRQSVYNSAKARRMTASRRKAEVGGSSSGLFGSLWSMVFGSSIATVIAEDEEEDENEAEDGRDLEADRVLVL